MNSNESSYSHFIQLRQQIVHQDQPRFNCLIFLLPLALNVHCGRVFILLQVGVRVPFLERKVREIQKIFFYQSVF